MKRTLFLTLGLALVATSLWAPDLTFVDNADKITMIWVRTYTRDARPSHLIMVSGGRKETINNVQTGRISMTFGPQSPIRYIVAGEPKPDFIENMPPQTTDKDGKPIFDSFTATIGLKGGYYTISFAKK